MRIAIDLPDDIAAALEGRWDNVPRRCLEAIAVEAYRTGALTESQVRRLLGFESRFQVHALFKERQVTRRYTAVDRDDDLSAHRELRVLPEASSVAAADSAIGKRLDELRRNGVVSNPASEVKGELQTLEETPGALHRFLDSRE